ncbi:MAG: hypothetical protein KDC38_02875 [Planctomycetes bacterium]|nr:hypothetical protein [Planctomycetota bacterium]
MRLVIAVSILAMFGCGPTTVQAWVKKNGKVKATTVTGSSELTVNNGSGQISAAGITVTGLDDTCIGSVHFRFWYDSNNDGEDATPPDLPSPYDVTLSGPGPVQIGGTTFAWNATMGPLRWTLIVTDCDGNVIMHETGAVS